jgi:CBS domain containing-hemolysin-like protein
MFSTALYIVLVILLVLANGFFVASEFSLVAVRRSRVLTIVEEGADNRAKTLLELVDNLNIYISATQLGITMSSLALGWIGEPAFARLLEAPLRGIVSVAARHTISFALAFTAITVMHIVLGELAPKTLALERAEKVALAIAWPMRLFQKIFRWPIRFLDWAGIRTVRMFGLHPTVDHASVYTVDELRHLIDASQKSGNLEPEEQKLLHGIFEFSDAEVMEVMVPRNAFSALDVYATLDETKKAFRELGYSRLPVYREHLDSIVGVVFRRDIEPYLEQSIEQPFDLEKLVHPPMFIPATAQLSVALRQMQSARTHLAFAVDEYGGIEGIITLEDILEEIVGEIDDEFDEETQAQIVKEGETYLLDGMLTVRDVNQHLHLSLPEEDSYTTIAGFVLAQAGRLLNVGDSVEFGEMRFTVEALERRRIRRVRMSFAREPDQS